MLISVTELAKQTKMTVASINAILSMPTYTGQVYQDKKGKRVVNKNHFFNFISSPEFKNERNYGNARDVYTLLTKLGIYDKNINTLGKRLSSLAKRGKITSIDPSREEGATKVHRIYDLKDVETVFTKLHKKASRVKKQTVTTLALVPVPVTAQVTTSVSNKESVSYVLLEANVDSLRKELQTLRTTVKELQDKVNRPVTDNSEYAEILIRLRVLKENGLLGDAPKKDLEFIEDMGKKAVQYGAKLRISDLQKEWVLDLQDRHLNSTAYASASN